VPVEKGRLGGCSWRRVAVAGCCGGGWQCWRQRRTAPEADAQLLPRYVQDAAQRVCEGLVQVTFEHGCAAAAARLPSRLMSAFSGC
jgi:hypothetical protein